MANKTSFIKLDRNILRWRWYKDANTFRVFVYLLITANYKDRIIDGIEVRRGQCLTTYKEMAKALKLSFKSVRNSVEKLKGSEELTVKRLSKCQLITLTNYDQYQGMYNFAFFVDMTNEGNHFDEKGQSFFEKRAITKGAEKQLDTALFLSEQEGKRAITLTKKGNHLDEKGQSRKESNQRKDQMNNYFNNNYKNNTPPPLTCARMRDIINHILSIYHSICVDYPRVKVLSVPIMDELFRSLETYSLDQFKEVFVKAESSHCLRGKNKLGRRATFDWIINADNMAKILNGNYDDPPNPAQSFDTDEFFDAALKKSYESK